MPLILVHLGCWLDSIFVSGSLVVCCLMLSSSFTSLLIFCSRLSCYSVSVLDGIGHISQPFTWQILILNLQRTNLCSNLPLDEYFIFKTFLCLIWLKPNLKLFLRLFLCEKSLPQPKFYLEFCSFSCWFEGLPFSLKLLTLQFLTSVGDLAD